MKKIFFFILTSCIAVLFLLATGSNNQSYAIGLGGTCRYYDTVENYGKPVPGSECDSGLVCDYQFTTGASGSCDGVSCPGICRKACDSFPGDTKKECNDSTEFCHYTAYTSGYGGNGYCVPHSVPHVAVGGFCEGTGQGNCKNGLICAQPAYNPKVKQNRPEYKVCIPAGGYHDYSCIARGDSIGDDGYVEDLPYYSCDGPLQCGLDVLEGCLQHPQAGNCRLCYFPTDYPLHCTCTSPGRAEAEKNGFTCYNNLGDEVSGYCGKANQACYDSPGATVRVIDLNITIPGAIRKDDGLHDIQCLSSPPDRLWTEPNNAPCLEPNTNDGTCAKVQTAFGPVSTDPVGFISSLFGILLGTAGMIAVLLIMRAGYRIMTARGNPEGIKEGREQIIAAIVGLMFLIFSFVLLQVIGVDLLRLPTDPGPGTNLIPEFGTCDVNNPRCEPGLVCNYNGAQGQCQRP